MKKYLFILVLFWVTISYGQDIIVMKSGEKQEVIIKEITDTQIKYVDYKDPEGVLFTIDKVLVKEIRFKTGRKMKMEPPEENEWYFADDKINNLTFNFLAFGSNTFAIGYERALAPGQSVFGELKIYGLGLRESEGLRNRSGFGMSISYRLKMFSFLFSSKKYRPEHVLNGLYIAPTLGFSTGKIKRMYYDYYADQQNFETINHSIVFLGLMGGMQFIVQRTLALDLNLGLMYYGGNDDNNFVFGGNFFGADGLLIGYNLRIGFLFGKQRLVDKNKKTKAEKIKGDNKPQNKFF